MSRSGGVAGLTPGPGSATGPRFEVARRLAHDMIQHDACDEAAREIAIEAHMQKGDRASALRTYRQYRDVLFAELQCDPSASLREMLQR